jgi:hypothetical protein
MSGRSKIRQNTCTGGTLKIEPLMASLVKGSIKILLPQMKGSPPCPNTIDLFRSPAMYAFLVSDWPAGCSSYKVLEVISRFSMPCSSCL